MHLALQGNMGLGKAIDYFTSHQIPVSLPLNDTQPYDLIIDFNGKLQRVSVKTSRNKTENNTYSVQLRNTGGASSKCKVRPFNKTSCDYIFIYTGDERLFLIPTENLNVVNSITVGKKYTEYEVHIKKLNEYIDEMEG